MALKSFMPKFTGEVPSYELYSFTPDAEHDPTQADQPMPRVLWIPDDYPIRPGQSLLVVRFPEVAGEDGIAHWDDLPDPVLSGLARVTARLRRYSQQALAEAKSVSLLISETSMPEPHAIFIPVHDRKDPQRLWDRTYADDDPAKAGVSDLQATQTKLALPEALRQDLDAQLAPIFWASQR